MSSKRGFHFAFMAASLLLLLAQPAWAMHISEGILPPKWAALWYLVAAGFVWWSVVVVKRRAEQDTSFKPFLALIGAGVFIISCMPVPVPTAGTCSHPCGTGVAAILIGPGPTIFVATIALLLQALFLAHGGLTTLGADVVSMGIVGTLTGYGVYKLLGKMGVPIVIAAFAAGLFSDWATYTATSFELATALHGDHAVGDVFQAILIAFIPTQLPLGILEGLVAAGAVQFLKTRRPDLLGPLRAVRTKAAQAASALVPAVIPDPAKEGE